MHSERVDTCFRHIFTHISRRDGEVVMLPCTGDGSSTLHSHNLPATTRHGCLVQEDEPKSANAILIELVRVAPLMRAVQVMSMPRRCVSWPASSAWRPYPGANTKRETSSTLVALTNERQADRREGLSIRPVPVNPITTPTREQHHKLELLLHASYTHLLASPSAEWNSIGSRQSHTCGLEAASSSIVRSASEESLSTAPVVKAGLPSSCVDLFAFRSRVEMAGPQESKSNTNHDITYSHGARFKNQRKLIDHQVGRGGRVDTANSGMICRHHTTSTVREIRCELCQLIKPENEFSTNSKKSGDNLCRRCVAWGETQEPEVTPFALETGHISVEEDVKKPGDRRYWDEADFFVGAKPQAPMEGLGGARSRAPQS
ncbi:hypothetical protein ACCO45_003838 [Purpureocillium lilacinum]|uniref:Uncharacterized protein n=1 Tax=Purpureocillium lilacinum TaxID=33203 RepID=A0ACC4E3U9_PURLI